MMKQNSQTHHVEVKKSDIFEEDKKNQIEGKNSFLRFSIGREISEFKCFSDILPIYCKNCGAVFSKNDLERKVSMPNGVILTCQFCEKGNTIEISANDLRIPNEPSVFYLLDNEGKYIQTTNLKNAEEVYNKQILKSKITIILCIDISGSMVEKLSNPTGIDSKYFKIKENPTRLECIKYAIDCYIKKLLQEKPNTKVGFVFFNDMIHILGDGSCLPMKTIDGSLLGNFNGLFGMAESDALIYIKNTITNSQGKLLKCLETLSCGGATALGPAFLYSLGLATTGAKGSEIILCTDGLSTKGFGKTETNDPIEVSTSKGMYSKMGQLAKKSSVKVSVISIVDEECNLDILSPIVDATGGSIIKVNPLKLNESLKFIVEDPLVAIDVKYDSQVNHCFEFTEINFGKFSKDKSSVTVELDNVTKITTFFNEIKLKEEEKLVHLNSQIYMNFCLTQNYPVQYKINFTNLAGQKCLLIITESHGVTSNEGKGSNTVHLASMKKRILKQQEFLLKKGHFKEEKKNSKITLTSSIMNSGGQELHSVP